MKRVIVLLLSLAAVACAQDKKIPGEKRLGEQSTGDKKRLASVTWDLRSHKLVWEVQKGTVENGEFMVKSSDKYEISPDDAVMAFAQEKRGFTPEEAASLHKLLDTLSLYCAESVIWWDQGQGDKVDDKGNSKKGHRVEERPKKNPPVKTDGLVARVAVAP